MAVETIQRVCAKIGERSPLSADLKTKWGVLEINTSSLIREKQRLSFRRIENPLRPQSS